MCALAVLAVVGYVATASAGALPVPPPQPGRFDATGAIDFSFMISRGVCAAPSEGSARAGSRRGPKTSGYCFATGASPRVTQRCGDVTITGNGALISALSGLRLNGNDALQARYHWQAGYTELDLNVHGTVATGFVRSVDGVCDTGALAFTAHHR
jgi:hypothetical protein